MTGLIAEAKEISYRKSGGFRGLRLGSIVLASLLFTEAVYFSALAVAWLVLPAVVGLRNILDAGCLFMLVTLGVVVVVDVAYHGPGSLLT